METRFFPSVRTSPNQFPQWFKSAMPEEAVRCTWQTAKSLQGRGNRDWFCLFLLAFGQSAALMVAFHCHHSAKIGRVPPALVFLYIVKISLLCLSSKLNSLNSLSFSSHVGCFNPFIIFLGYFFFFLKKLSLIEKSLFSLIIYILFPVLMWSITNNHICWNVLGQHTLFEILELFAVLQ